MTKRDQGALRGTKGRNKTAFSREKRIVKIKIKILEQKNLRNFPIYCAPLCPLRLRDHTLCPLVSPSSHSISFIITDIFK